MKSFVLQCKRACLIFILSICSQCLLQGQTVNTVPSPVIASPNAAEIGRFGAVPVGLFTGTIQHDVPVYEFGNANVSVPISLRYSSNGFTVDKIASTVGYDWSLDAGGVISHSISKDPDSYTVNNRDYATQAIGKTDLEKYYLLNNFDPVDIFTFTLPGASGSFYLDNNGKPVVIKKGDNLSITFNINSRQFTIKTPDGTQYIFADYVWTAFQNFESWYLSSIKDPSGDHIDFKYSPAKSFVLGLVNREVYFPVLDQSQVMGSPYSREYMSTRVAADRYLERIELAGVGAVVFTNTYNRSDSESEPKVDEITVLNEQGTIIRKVKLNYTFVQSSSQYDYHLNGNDYDAGYLYHKYRMFLNEVEFKDNGNSKVYSYTFQYNDLSNLPCRHSYSKDFWGYFNGAPNTDLLNSSDYYWLSAKYSANVYSSLVTLITSGSSGNYCDRSANYLFSQKGMLSRITFPTSGYSQIYYEGHRNAMNEQVGGCRVARVETFDSDNLTPVPEIKVYTYPEVMTNYDPSIYNKNQEFVERPFYYTWGCGPPGAAGTSEGHVIRLSPSFQDNFTTGGYHLSYTKVEILSGLNGENGSEEHEFYAVPQVNSSPIVGRPIFTPFKRYNTDLFNGTPTRVALKKNNVVQKEIIYNYDFNNTKYKQSLVCDHVYYNANAVKQIEYIYQDFHLVRIDCWDLPFERLVQFYDVSRFELYSNFPYLKSKKETVVDDNASAITTETFYEYSDAPYTHVRSTITKRSDGKDIKVVYKYPFDKLPGLQDMITSNITSPVIEQQEYVVNNGQSLLKSTVSVDYTQIKPGLFLPTSIYQLDNADLLTTGGYTTDGNGLIIRDSNFDLIKQLSYDTQGNITKEVSSDAIPVSYMWEYTNPIVKAVGASPAEIAYTSFESADQGGWTFSYITPTNSPCNNSCNSSCTSAAQSQCSSPCTSSCGGDPDCYNSCFTACSNNAYGNCMTNCVPACNSNTVTVISSTAKTGTQSFKGSTISKNVPSGYYRIGYWVKKSGTANGTVTINGSSVTITNTDWQYKTFITAGAVTSLSFTLSGAIVDDIRLCPRDARMTIYNYKQLVGLTSMTDENGFMTNYEYDSFGRLKLVKDNAGNIMKQYQYHYNSGN
jgi:YD repeat-containing protein